MPCDGPLQFILCFAFLIEGKHDLEADSGVSLLTERNSRTPSVPVGTCPCQSQNSQQCVVRILGVVPGGA